MQLLLIFYSVGGIVSASAGWGIAKFASGSRSRGLRLILVWIASTLPVLAFVAWARSNLWLDPKGPMLLMYVTPLLIPSGVGAYLGSRARVLRAN